MLYRYMRQVEHIFVALGPRSDELSAIHMVSLDALKCQHQSHHNSPSLFRYYNIVSRVKCSQMHQLRWLETNKPSKPGGVWLRAVFYNNPPIKIPHTAGPGSFRTEGESHGMRSCTTFHEMISGYIYSNTNLRWHAIQAPWSSWSSLLGVCLGCCFPGYRRL